MNRDMNERVQTIKIANGIYIGFDDEMMWHAASTRAFKKALTALRVIATKYKEEKRQREYAERIERLHFSKKKK